MRAVCCEPVKRPSLPRPIRRSGIRLFVLASRAYVALLLCGLLPAGIAAEIRLITPPSEYTNINKAASVDHSAWQRFLNRYVVTEGSRTRVRYAAVSPEDRALLDSYLVSMSSIDAHQLADNDAFAYWVNLYNALTVRVVLDHPEKETIRNMGGSWFRPGPWRQPLIEVNGQTLSLDDIEHGILRADWADHRIHFVVNCASVGCPNLSPRAYLGHDLEARLNSAEQEFLRDSRAISIASDGTVILSTLFDWYESDFAPDLSGLLSYLADHRPDLADALNRANLKVDYEYDWTLNKAP